LKIISVSCDGNETIDWSKVQPISELPGFWEGRIEEELSDNNITLATPEDRIVGGEIAKPHSHPYQAGLLVTIRSDLYRCGGSIIGSKTILTAAHCLEDSTKIIVILGAHNLQDDLESTQQRQTVDASGYRIHKDYENRTLLNDIALLILPKSVTVNKYVAKIDLPWDTKNKFVGSIVIMTGWGKMSDENGLSPALRFTFDKIVNNPECKKIYKSYTNNMICNSGAGGKNSCGGDSGGPLTTKFHRKKIQIGLVSYGKKLCGNGISSVNTRITSYLDWIRDNSPDFSPEALLANVPES
jgi:chymotrypsin